MVATVLLAGAVVGHRVAVVDKVAGAGLNRKATVADRETAVDHRATVVRKVTAATVHVGLQQWILNKEEKYLPWAAGLHMAAAEADLLTAEADLLMAEAVHPVVAVVHQAVGVVRPVEEVVQAAGAAGPGKMSF